MELSLWHIWIIVGILLFIIEIFAPTFLAACVGIGCITAGIFSAIDCGIEIQLISFSFGTVIAFFGIRPFTGKYADKEKVKTNVDALVNKIGKVTVAIDNSKNQGRIVIEGDDWRAESENNEIINVGDRVQISKINSTILIVKPIIN